MEEMMKIKKAFTHGGKFHSDDVFSAALLRILFPEIEIIRGFVIPEDFDGLVFDIGLGAFDHHQEKKEVRENGCPYAAFGLLWREFGTRLLNEEEALLFDESFIQPLDYSDNTGEPCDLARRISIFNPSWDEEGDADEFFFRAVDIAQAILERQLVYAKGREKANLMLEEAMEHMENHILILPRFIPWKKYLVDSEVYFAIFPSERGGYNAQPAIEDAEEEIFKVPFPQEWWGKPKEELQKISGIETLTFCHATGFLLAADTLEDAVKACEEAMKIEN